MYLYLYLISWFLPNVTSCSFTSYALLAIEEIMHNTNIFPLYCTINITVYMLSESSEVIATPSNILHVLTYYITHVSIIANKRPNTHLKSYLPFMLHILTPLGHRWLHIIQSHDARKRFASLSHQFLVSCGTCNTRIRLEIETISFVGWDWDSDPVTVVAPWWIEKERLWVRPGQWYDRESLCERARIFVKLVWICDDSSAHVGLITAGHDRSICDLQYVDCAPLSCNHDHGRFVSQHSHIHEFFASF